VIGRIFRSRRFLAKFTAGKGRKKDIGVINLFMNYGWPGNVRELENTIERLVILTMGDSITIEGMPDSIKDSHPGPDLMPGQIPDEGLDLETLLGNAEKNLLRQALEKTGGVKTEAAKLLGLTFRSFRHRLQKYDLS
jgi:two-component system response regulator PilR (NtrC family)